MISNIAKYQAISSSKTIEDNPKKQISSSVAMQKTPCLSMESIPTSVLKAQSNINFGSALYKNVYGVAKKQVIEALQGEAPFEKFVAMNKMGTIIGMGNGSHRTVNIPPRISNVLLNSQSDIVLMHGHPCKKHLIPLSIADFKTATGLNVREVTAFDRHGNHSTLKINPIAITQKINNEVTKAYKDTYRAKRKKLFPEYDPSLNKEIKAEISRAFENSKEYADMMHNFWKDMGERHGFTYETNIAF